MILSFPVHWRILVPPYNSMMCHTLQSATDIIIVYAQSLSTTGIFEVQVLLCNMDSLLDILSLIHI